VQPFVAEVRGRGWVPALQDGCAHGRQLLSVDEVHTWFERSLVGDCSDSAETWPINGFDRTEPGSGLCLRTGTVEDLPVIGLLPTVSQSVAARRLAAGVRWWLLLDGEEPVFSCWIFSRVMRMVGAPQGALVMPPDVVFLEDSVTNPNRRGSGLGPASLSNVCRLLGKEGSRWVLTKVKTGNRAAERLVEKAGFVPMATVRIWRRGPMGRTWAVMAGGAVNTWLPGALGAVNSPMNNGGSNGV
jgi:Acetyltransferase (GNAT) family